jgi:hypothetical protein
MTWNQQKHGGDQITGDSEGASQAKCESLINRSTLIQTSDAEVCRWISTQHCNAWFTSPKALMTMF